MMTSAQESIISNKICTYKYVCKSYNARVNGKIIITLLVGKARYILNLLTDFMKNFYRPIEAIGISCV